MLSGADRLDGSTGRDYLIGFGGNDRLIGGAGGDELFGGSDRDKVYGGAGDDFLAGGGGIDLLDGGADDDTFLVDQSGDKVVEGLGRRIRHDALLGVRKHRGQCREARPDRARSAHGPG